MMCDAAPFLYSTFPIHFSYTPADNLFLDIYNPHCVTLPYELIGIFYCILTLSSICGKKCGRISVHNLPDFRLYCCSFNRKTFHIAVHKCIESSHTFRFWIQCAAFLICKHFIIKEAFQSLTFFFIYQIRSKKCDSPGSAFTCSSHYRYRCIDSICQNLLSYAFCLE